MSLPRITVITPSFNQGRFLRRTIHSVLDQNYPNLQYIIIDGGSTDQSAGIIKQYQDRLDYWVSEPDKGQSDAINKGLLKADGDLVTWINSDDLLMPGTLFEVARTWSKNRNLGLITGSCLRIGPDNEYLFLHCVPRQYRFFAKRGLIYIDQPGAFWRRDVFDSRPIDESLTTVMDHDLWYRIVLAGHPTKMLMKSTAAFRLHDTSKTLTIQNIFNKEARSIREKYAMTTDVGLPAIICYRLLKVVNGNYARKLFRQKVPSKKAVKFLAENQRSYS